MHRRPKVTITATLGSEVSLKQESTDLQPAVVISPTTGTERSQAGESGPEM